MLQNSILSENNSVFSTDSNPQTRSMLLFNTSHFMHQETFKISCQLSAIITYYSLKVFKFLIYTTRALNQRDIKNIPNSAVPIQHFTPISFIKSFLV